VLDPRTGPAVPADRHRGQQSTGLDAGQVIRWKSWHRWTAICLLAYIYLAVAIALQRQHDAGSDLDAGLILCVPKTSSTSCDQAVLVDQACGVGLPSDAVPVEINRFG
jgi:hypothetical protein